MLNFLVTKNIDECKRLWEEWSPKENLFDEWDYRICLFDEKYFEPYFIVGKVGDETVGILPLWKDIKGDCYEFFGGYFTERNRFFVKNKKYIEEFLNQAPSRTCLAYIESTETRHAELVQCETRYYLDLEGHEHSMEKYMSAFSSKHRKNLRHDLNSVGSYIVHVNRMDDYRRMVELNRLRFGKDSFFAGEVFIEGFLKFLETAKRRGELQMLSIELDGAVEAVEAAVLYKNDYNVIMGGNNLAKPNVGKAMIIEHIKRAIQIHAKNIDFLSSDSGWKKLWKLTEEAVYRFANYPEEEFDVNSEEVVSTI